MRLLSIGLLLAVALGCGNGDDPSGPVGPVDSSGKTSGEETVSQALPPVVLCLNAENLLELARVGNFEMVRQFVEVGLSVETADRFGRTVLHYAAEEGHLSVVQYLVEHGATVNAIDNEGSTALLLAAGAGHLSIVQYLEEAQQEEAQQVLARLGIEYNDGDEFLDSAYEGNLEVVKLFVRAGMSVGQRRDSSGWTALHYAALGGHLLIVQYLVEAGADVNAKDDDGSTALHSAARGHLSMVQYLVEAGADVNAAHNEGWTALHSAALGGHLSIVQYLVEAGADVNAAHNEGRTVLHEAAWGGHLDVVRYLVEHGADVNAKDDFIGRTTLHSAALGGHLSIVQYLVEAGVDVNAKDTGGATARDLAAEYGHTDVVEYLESVF